MKTKRTRSKSISVTPFSWHFDRMTDAVKENNYTSLNEAAITELADHLYRRVTERFPESGLRKVSRQIHATARVTQKRITKEAEPIYIIRFTSWLLIALIILGLLTAIAALGAPSAYIGFIEFVQALEAAINDLVLIGAAIFFLTSIENRIRRNKILKYLHELRSLCHVIDMHQLTKDPGRLFMGERSTESSPKTELNSFQLSRYLDYCSELLSLVGKMAGLYAQSFNDPTVLAAVTEVEQLSNNISSKIWQKLMIVHSLGDLKEVA